MANGKINDAQLPDYSFGALRRFLNCPLNFTNVKGKLCENKTSRFSAVNIRVNCGRDKETRFLGSQARSLFTWTQKLADRPQCL
ncbi:hypothetical protein [Laspinema palackyanum]|uniref:hypothetical protein n=1 Tax=Laspinema palackyanum TaxID=3231601 RepID=UPI00345DD9DA|nr:hypothetical protein [Laspinema sp. D2c]